MILDTPDQPVPTEVIVLGAGYIGVFTAMSLRMLLDEQGKKHIPVRVLAQAFPKGISTIKPGFREPEPADNYSSQVSGGWVMPVSIKPLKDQEGGTTLWCSLVRKAQSFWSSKIEDPVLSKAVHKTQSLVFYDKLADEEKPKDKSGVREVNELCPKVDLYPEHKFRVSFYALPVTHSSDQQTSHPLYFDEVETFDNVIQVDTVSVLLDFTKKLIDANVELIQTTKPIANWAELSQYFRANRTIIVNASGNGACDIFGCAQSQPIRGDLVIIRLPTSKLTEKMREASKYGFWAGGSHYVFLRYSLDGQWLEVVLGGTFLEDDHDLTVNPGTVSHIVTFWLNFFHSGSGTNVYHEESSQLVERVMKKLKLSESSE